MKQQLIDLIFPLAEPFTEEEAKRESELADNERKECNARVAALPNNSVVITEYLDECAALLSEEDERRRGVESRLTSILGLSSIAGTIVFGGILALASGTLAPQQRGLRVLMAFGALYLVLQICSAILAAIRGLDRQGYDTATASSILPAPNAVTTEHLKRRISTLAGRLIKHRLQNGKKMTQMATAHRAMKNFVGGLIILALVGTCYALTAKPTGLGNTVRTLIR